MIFLLKIVAYLILSLFVTWGGFLMMMTFKRNYQEGKLNSWNKIFGYPWLLIFICLDTYFNVVWGTLLFLDIPRTVLFTKRLDYFLSRPNREDYSGTWLPRTYWKNWRYRLAYYFCTRFLDSFDPDGKHCSNRR
jgi:hypothetical protein